MLSPVANQITAAHALQGGTQQFPVFRIVVTQKRFMRAPNHATSGRFHHFRIIRHFVQRIFAGVVHGGRHRHRGWHKGLYLIQLKIIFL